MSATTDPPEPPAGRPPDWESFYRHFRKPGYVPGYEITSKLGGGTFGLVFKARKESIGKDYAIKFLKLDDDAVRDAVLRELDAVQHFAQLDHPNLVQIEDRGEVDGIPFLIMQFAGHTTLRDRIEDCRGAAVGCRDEVLPLFLQACRGVAALHAHSLVHFDLKPANVFLKGNVARVGDYGLSKLVAHARGTLSMGRGTPTYMAPEILQRRGDHRSDVYSLGVMLYEILTGAVPFSGESEWHVLQQHETAEPEWPIGLTPHERAVLQRCLQKDPAARFASVDELVAALTGAPAAIAAVSSSPPAAPVAPLPPIDGGALPPCVPPPLPIATPPPLPRRRHRKSAAGMLGILPTILVVIAVLMLLGTFSRREARLRGRNQATRADYVAERELSRPGGLEGRLDEFVAAAQRRVQTAMRRCEAPELRELRFADVAAPGDMPAYVHLVEGLAEAAAFSAGHAAKLERYGRPVFLAAVALLQSYDYDDPGDCRCAAHTTDLLAHLTGLSGLRLRWSGAEPAAGDTCGYRVYADAWRELAETFATTDADYERLLAAKGHGRG